jgi:L-alanine-DL-glutamate epimerase-like enolase superfamily enzyme
MGSGGENERERFIGTRVSELFNLEEGTGADVPWWLEKALYDLAGNILDAPVYELLGAAGPRAVLLYSGAIYFDDLMPRDKPQGIEGVLKACRQDYDAGYRAFKLKIGRGYRWMDRAEGLARDIEVTRAVRERFDDCRILVDVNDGYTVENAVEYVKGVADCDLYWIEEPFLEDADDLRRLKDAMRLAGCTAFIADGEARRGRPDTPTAYGGYTKAFVDRLYALADEDLVDVFVLDLGLVGYTRWCKAMPELRKAGVWASPHTWAWIPRPYYAAHIAAGVGNVCIIEGIPGTTAGVDYSAYTIKNGYLQMPRTPGFGLTLED